MPAKRQTERVSCTYFTWLLGTRGGVYTADGRSNLPNLGRHSLGTRDEDDARKALHKLDLAKAVEIGRANRRLLDGPADELSLSLEEGRRLYEAHIQRPRVTGGTRPTTHKRYRAVFDKFLGFARSEGVSSWNAVTATLLERYAAWLDGEGYAYRTEYLELTTLKQSMKWLVEAGHLPVTSLVRLALRKPDGTDTYCWRREEVQALIAHCQAEQDLKWLACVILGLACTGLRISELASLRWSDVDWNRNLIFLADETSRASRPGQRQPRTIKNHRSRSFPVHPQLRPVLSAMPRRNDGVIFHGPRGGALKPDTVRTILVRDVLSALAKRFPTPPGEFGFREGRLHSFRHFFCSVCATSGIPEQVVMQWLGHRQSAMVRHYFHLHNDEAQRQMERVQFIASGEDAAG